MSEFTTVLLIFTPAFAILLNFRKAFKAYRQQYQVKIKPSFPFTTEAVNNEMQNNPLRLLARAPIMPFLWWKTVFEKQTDPELKQAQKKVRLSLALFLGYIFSLISIATAWSVISKHI